RVRAAAAAAASEGGRRRLADAEEQHEKLARHIEDARHLHRLGELLSSFRNSLVATVGPRLSAQAGELFAQLTDHEYDDLEVDPDTYEIKVLDQGRAYGMDRYSGSETDLANLALRVAISEHVQFQSGGTVGLLVLDEVFGPLDDDRKERMLLALERLKGRFRQLLVVTHDVSIKEQLPHALEVVKLPGRRATVRNLTP
ncbi:MAG TPA: SbcC/MukB-like Walker B domain-containing protein, partial [Acidimicrobiales bacterium]